MAKLLPNERQQAGSTHLYLADLLPRNQQLTVVTNALSIASRLLERPGLRTILIGGEIDVDIEAQVAFWQRDFNGVAREEYGEQESRWTGDGFYEAIIRDPDGNTIEITG